MTGNPSRALAGWSVRQEPFRRPVVIMHADIRTRGLHLISKRDHTFSLSRQASTPSFEDGILIDSGDAATLVCWHPRPYSQPQRPVANPSR